MNTHPAEEKRFGLLATAGLIAGFYTGSSMREIYELIIAHYETLLGILEDSETAAEISKLMSLPVEKTKDITESIIASLLFNKSNDPFISLGLRHNVPLQDARHRWKRLMTLYHPDKHHNSIIYDDKTKRINEAFAEVNKKRQESPLFEERSDNYEIAKQVRKTDGKVKTNKEYFKRLRYVPFFILGLAVLIAVSLLSFCVTKVASTSP